MRTRSALLAVILLGSACVLTSVPAAATGGQPVITTIAGTGTSGTSPDGTLATSAQLHDPFGVAVDGSGDVIIADTDNGLIRMVAGETCVSSCPFGLAPVTAGHLYTIAGGGAIPVGPAALPGTHATLGFPYGLAVTKQGDVVIADQSGSLDLLEDSTCASGCPYNLAEETPGDIVQLAGGGGSLPTTTPAAGNSVQLPNPTGVAVDAHGNIIDAEYEGFGSGGGDGAVLFLAATSCAGGCPFGAPSSTGAGQIVLLGGTGTGTPSTTPQPIASLGLGYFNGAAITPDGYLALTDSQSETGNPLVELVAGTACASDCPYGAPAMAAGDLVVIGGGGTQALTPSAPAMAGTTWQIQLPSGVAASADGLAVADRNGNEVAFLAASSCHSSCPFDLSSTTAGHVYLIAGDGTQGYTGDNGPAIQAELYYPENVAFDPANGDLYVADTSNSAIRLITNPRSSTPTPPTPPTTSQGYWLDGADGGVFAFGSAPFLGSLPSMHLTAAAPITGMAADPSADGYWLDGADGGVFAFGAADFDGSLPLMGIVPHEPIVGMAADPAGGYWLVGSDGGVFAFGGAPFEGSLPSIGVVPSAPIVGIAPAPGGTGYWLAAADGSIYALGSAPPEGTAAGLGLVAPIVGIAADPTATGFWLAGADGGVFAFGGAPFESSLPQQRIAPIAPITGIAATTSGEGYRLAGSDGGVFAFGDALFAGSLVSISLLPYRPIVEVSTQA